MVPYINCCNNELERTLGTSVSQHFSSVLKTEVIQIIENKI